MSRRNVFLSVAEGFMIYGLIVFIYGTIVIHVTQTWSGDWPVDRSLPWLTLDMFVMISFALSFFGFLAWRYLKRLEQPKQN